MTSEYSGTDIVAYDGEGRVLLLAEVKSRGGASESWATGLRKNILSRGSPPEAKYFLIATPEHLYLWNQQSAPAEMAPEFTINASGIFRPYFQKFHQEPANIGPQAFELLVLTWLSDIARSGCSPNQEAPAKWLSEFGGSLTKARIEINPMQ